MIELRFFGGLSVEETASVLRVSPDTVKRDWRFAKAWLMRELRGEAKARLHASMTAERWRRIEELYHAAQARPADERAAFLDEACAGDATLRQEVESLLAQPVSADEFLERPARGRGPADHADAVRRGDAARAVRDRRPAWGGRHGRGLSRARHASSAATSRSRSCPSSSRSIPIAWRGSDARRSSSPRSTIPTSAPSTASKTPDGIRALVLELVDGPTLADRIAQGPIPLDDALPIARQIARRSRPRTSRGSFIATSSRPTSKSAGRHGEGARLRARQGLCRRRVGGRISRAHRPSRERDAGRDDPRARPPT